MIKTLYKNFQHWSDTGSVYIMSDPHFGDIDMNWRLPYILPDNYMQYSRLGDAAISGVIANQLVDNINKLTHKGDTLIILGDIGDIEYVKQLKAGHKVLVKGNHDRGSNNFERKITTIYVPETASVEEAKREPDFVGFYDSGISRNNLKMKLACYDNHLFDEVYSGPLFIAEKLVLSHEPLEGLEEIALNLHGHVHTIEGNDDDSHLNCVVERNSFFPINLSNIIKIGRLNKILGIHRVTIDKASEGKQRRVNG